MIRAMFLNYAGVKFAIQEAYKIRIEVGSLQTENRDLNADKLIPN
jgi:hypothetical protein